jgi:UDP-N-acetylglucosamine--N-acetylmuramyl-(pentapeptide) pyrophosphoryl-undecaprenol N-acetylglucosamine transferase
VITKRLPRISVFGFLRTCRVWGGAFDTEVTALARGQTLHPRDTRVTNFERGVSLGQQDHDLWEQLSGKRVLILASTGGHLAQAVRWFDYLNLDKGSVVVTFDTSQSRALLEGRHSFFVDYVPSRGYREAFKATRQVLKEFGGDSSFDAVLSTGAALAIAGWPLAMRNKIPFHFIESVSRLSGPSATGRVLVALPGVHTWAQHDYKSSQWRSAPSLLGSFSAVEGSEESVDRPLKMFVTLGTIRPYRFDRAVDSVLACLGPDDSVTWQLGVTTRDDLPGVVHAEMSHDEMVRAMKDADVVVSHAGVGTILELLNMGVRPVIFTRESSRNEHVDDHQAQIAEYLASFDLGFIADQSCSREDLLRVAASEIKLSVNRGER